MIRCGLLLAAGASRRFGAADKLLADLAGRPLVAHAAAAMRQARLEDRVAVIADPALIPHLEGFRIVTVPPGQQSDSLRAGLAAACGCQLADGQGPPTQAIPDRAIPDRLLIALGDMPDVTGDLLDRVVALCRTDSPSACQGDDDDERPQTAPLPPACFPVAWFDALRGLTGDRGAGALIRDLPQAQLLAAPGALRDVDRPEDLVRHRSATGRRHGMRADRDRTLSGT